MTKHFNPTTFYQYDRLTGRTVTEPTAEDWTRLKEYAR